MSEPLFPQPEGSVVRVALPVPIDSLFDYAVPPELVESARPGCRARVPFSGRSLTGVIIERVDEGAGTHRAASNLAVLRNVLDAEPVLSPAILSILEEAARATLCPYGLAVATALPAGSAPRVARHLVLTRRGELALESGAAKEPLRRLLEELKHRPASASSLARRTRASTGRPPPVDELLRDGLVHWVEIEREPSAKIRTQRFARVRDGVKVDLVCRTHLARAPKQAEILRRIAQHGDVATATLAGEFKGAASLLRSLSKRELVELVQRAVPRDVAGGAVDRDSNLPLTPEQAEALEPVFGAIDDERDERFLLHGVTGSGKTEVYLRAIERALSRGRQALVLVPEITLTHQIVARLRARFGDQLAVLHSGLRPSDRLDQWQRLRRGQTPIAVGARSALFAPLENLGVIVIDEEHDGAYKNEEGFRYHARDLAGLRAASAGCPLILGSATPSMETRYAAERGILRRLVLARRIGGRPLPAVELVDMTAEKAKAPPGRKIILSGPLRRALRRNLDEGGQAILFLNRRGFSTQIFCFDCGHAERCGDCDVALVFHAADHSLRCHYCDFVKAPPEFCGGCGAPDTALLGVGTERLEEEIRSRFSEARVARLDRDTAARRGYTEWVLDALREGEIDVLIGTQMVAKGHDFPGVRLVGVVAADLGLHMPDFRAAERTFQLLTQVAGRAGRAGAPGRVVVQSFVPDHYAIEPVLRHDYELFYGEELQHRASLGYPPFGGLAQVTLSSEVESAARDAGQRLVSELGSFAKERGVEVLGPAPAAIARLRGRSRFHLLLKSKDADGLHEVARRLYDASSRLPRNVQAVVDVNPINML